MNNIKFSVVIPTYRRHSSLQECIKALCSQLRNKEDFEIVVINDGGEGEPLGNSYSQINIRYLSIEHKGAAAARNFALRNAKGEIILFLDDDSIVAEGWADATVKNWQEFADVDGIGGYVLCDKIDTIYVKVNADIFNWYFEQANHGEYCNFISTCNAGYKKEILERVNGFDEQFKAAYGEDRDLNIKIIKQGGKLRLARDILVYHDKNLYFYNFIRRHFNYGKGAFMVYEKYPGLKYLSIRNYIKLYASVLSGYRNLGEKFLAFLLLTISQVATIFGYIAATLNKK